MKILKIHVGANPKEGFVIKVDEHEMRETAKTYSKKGMVVMKEKILKVDSIWRLDQFNIVQYFSYCFEDQKDIAISQLKKHIRQSIIDHSYKIDNLLKAIEND